MLYTRNKGCFKKQTARVEHKGAHQHIINMVKEIVGRDSSYHGPNESFENKCTNNQKPESDPKPIAPNFSKESKQPLFCQSVFESAERKGKATSKSFFIEHVIDYSIKSIDNSSKAVRAQRQYISLLESKIGQLEKQLKAQKESKIVEKSLEENHKQDLQLQKLIRFYHRARNIIVLQSVELLECKNAVGEGKSNQGRIKSINTTMAKSQELLQVYRRGIQKGSPRKQSSDLSKLIEITQLKDLCEYQEKTIEFLRKQTQPTNQFNQIKLLRHQINRVCTQNQKLLQKVSKLSKNEQKQRISISPPRQNKQELKKMLSELTQKQNCIQKLQIEVDELRMHLMEQSNKLFTMEEEKKCAMEMAESATERNQQLQQNIVDLEIIIEKNEAELHELKTSTVKAANKIVIQNHDIATTEELCKELKPYPRYEKLLFSIINQYQTKISELRGEVCSQRQLKQKYKKWASEVYHLMESAQIPAEILQKHMNQLYAFNDKMDCSKIQKFLRQIRAFSIGIDQKDIKQMQAELEEYIISLKSRNQVIREADCEDGSSVAVSDTFTDRQFDQQ